MTKVDVKYIYKELKKSHISPKAINTKISNTSEHLGKVSNSPCSKLNLT